MVSHPWTLLALSFSRVARYAPSTAEPIENRRILIKEKRMSQNRLTSATPALAKIGEWSLNNGLLKTRLREGSVLEVEDNFN